MSGMLQSSTFLFLAVAQTLGYTELFCHSQSLESAFSGRKQLSGLLAGSKILHRSCIEEEMPVPRPLMFQSTLNFNLPSTGKCGIGITSRGSCKTVTENITLCGSLCVLVDLLRPSIRWCRVCQRAPGHQRNKAALEVLRLGQRNQEEGKG